ncbi:MULTISPECIES: secondary thiamine-phosphate synthase enzyme YjbQ [Marinomonas]|uniref:secondary thiamine-phosphate synthase enzyme YjbQ n=1 Tax=Marinomonas TaxID=28253 RepID=UPI0010555964|nr:secondary thiamine-phosphate synthase enzyme YjbQ [Marinomonas sp. KMM3893]
MWYQKEIRLPSKPRGFHLITDDIVRAMPELKRMKIGVCHVFIQHTSASLTINENADATVREDFENYFNRTVREGESYYRHNDEGDDDLPAHIKTSLLGSSVQIPISNGALNMGIWQGIYLGEHRDYGGERSLVITLNGEE